MKKIIALGILLTSTLAFSQIRVKKDIELAPQIGTATSNYYGDAKLNNDPISSVNLGVNADYFFNSRWSLRSGLFFQTMGSKYSDGYFNYKETLKYVTIPLNANWHFGSTRKWYLNFGPSFGFLTSAENNGEDIKDKAESFQLGLNVGIGYKIEVSKDFSILIDYQGMSGLTEIAKDSEIPIKNQYSSFNVGGVFKL